MALLLRAAGPEDVPALARLHVAGWRAAYPGLMPDEVLEGLSEDRFQQGWRERLAQAPRSTLVALADGEPVGFAAAGPSRDPDAEPERTAELYALYVHPERWGTGAGWRLWSGTRQRLLAERYAEATLWVLEGNRRARAFYERVGFRLEPGAVKAIEREGARVPEVRYRLPLG